MNLLALTSSSSNGVLALLSQGKIEEYPLGSRHSENLFPGLRHLLLEKRISLNQIDGVAIDLGPGSFTGIRVAVNFAKSLCYSLKLPVFCTNSFNLVSHGIIGPGVIFQNAYQNSVFLASFDSSQSISKIELFDWGQIPKRFFSQENWYGRTRDLTADLKMKEGLNIQDRYPQVSSLIEIALSAPPDVWTKDWKSILPLYIKASAAEELRAKSILKN
ncbi:MAG: tRNA (adenosine(37)-N6)-threonylcarbamoyltransferase complex dimerization subunit type 1 TsaB [Bdellovibrio sp.]